MGRLLRQRPVARHDRRAGRAVRGAGRQLLRRHQGRLQEHQDRRGQHARDRQQLDPLGGRPQRQPHRQRRQERLPHQRGHRQLRPAGKTADTATSATTAATATNANALGGIAASGFTRPDCASQSGALKGFARVNRHRRLLGDLHDHRSREPLQLQRRNGRGPPPRRGNLRGQVQRGEPGARAHRRAGRRLPTITSVTTAKTAATGTFRVQTVDTAAGTAQDNVPFVIATL